MKVLLVYDSKYGNTEKVALALERGLRSRAGVDVQVLSQQKASEDDFQGRDLWIIGSPTRWGGPTFRMRTLLDNAVKYEGKGAKAILFDTRYKSMQGGAVDRMQSMLQKGNVKVLLPPMSFFVSTAKGPLLEGEEGKAESWGKEIASRFL